MKKIILSALCIVFAMLMLAACGRGNVGDYTTIHSTSTTTHRTTTESKSSTTVALTTTVTTQNSTTMANNG